MRAYSIDLRKRIVHAYENEQITQRELAERFQVSLRCVQMLLKRWREEGTVEPKPHGGGQPRKITGEKLERLRRAVEQQPDATLEELRERCALDVSLVCVFRTLEREEFQ